MLRLTAMASDLVLLLKGPRPLRKMCLINSRGAPSYQRRHNFTERGAAVRIGSCSQLLCRARAAVTALQPNLGQKSPQMRAETTQMVDRYPCAHPSPLPLALASTLDWRSAGVF